MDKLLVWENSATKNYFQLIRSIIKNANTVGKSNLHDMTVTFLLFLKNLCENPQINSIDISGTDKFNQFF